MSTTEDEKLVLEAIDELKRRKARPDADRICNYLLRHCNVERSQSVAILNRVILCNPAKVIKVSYKGSISYRRPFTAKEVKIGEKYQVDFTQLLRSAFSELIVLEPDYLHSGVPPDEFEHFVYKKEKPLYNKKSVKLIIQYEIKKGTLVRLETGNLSLVNDKFSSSEMSPSKKTSISLYDSPMEIVVGTNQIESPEASFTLLSDEIMCESDDGDEDDIVTVKEEDITTYKHIESDDEDIIMKVKEKEHLKESDEKVIEHLEYDDKVKEEENLKKNDENMYEQEHIDNEYEDVNIESDEDVIIKVKEEENLIKTDETMCEHIECDDKEVIMEVNEEEHFKIEKVKGKRGPTKKILSSVDMATTKNSIKKMETKGFRDGVRRKRAAKKVFDPSDNLLPSKRRGRLLVHKNKEVNAPTEKHDVATPKDKDKVELVLSGICCICHKQKSAKNEKLLACRDCSNKSHPSCSRRKSEGKKGTWQCVHCKTCAVCNETDEYAGMMICCVCDDAYHISCHVPPISPKMKIFKCYKCTAKCFNPKPTVESKPKPPLANHTPSVWGSGANSQVTSTPRSSRQPEFSFPLLSPASGVTSALIATHSSSGVSSGLSSGAASAEEYIDYTIPDESIPDATGWTVTQVSEYLKGEGFPEQAQVFEMNEIDGNALLLLTRSDVVSGNMFEKLGPALKAYKQVRKLQIRRSENFLFWAT